MGAIIPWASSLGSDFNYDFHVSVDPDVAAVEYNYRSQHELEARDVSWKDWIGEQPGMSGFVRDGGKVFHAYSAYARGLDALWGAYLWLDRAPLGRNEDGYWWRLHDDYERLGPSPPLTASAIAACSVAAAAVSSWSTWEAVSSRATPSSPRDRTGQTTSA